MLFMKSVYVILSVLLIIAVSCNKDLGETPPPPPQPAVVYFQEINRMITSSDIIETIELDLNNSGTTNLTFQIVNLNEFNNPPLQSDSLAVIVSTSGVQILDNSNFGYADALNSNFVLNSTLNWRLSNSFVLGTLANGGNFAGQGPKYLGFRVYNSTTDHYYGWVLLECSQARDTLTVVSCGMNEALNKPIQTGQQ
jgi:hypothetical protein